MTNYGKEKSGIATNPAQEKIADLVNQIIELKECLIRVLDCAKYGDELTDSLVSKAETLLAE